jgi:hypothetical protein
VGADLKLKLIIFDDKLQLNDIFRSKIDKIEQLLYKDQ